MKKPLLLLGLLWLLVCTIPLQAARKAKASLLNSSGQPVGTARLTEKPDGVQLRLQVLQLPPGIHGFHIHAVGQCQAPDFMSAGPHFNPEGKHHGLDNPQGHHLGDLQNLNVGADGKASVTILIPGANLGEGPNSLFHKGGTSLVIHAQPDDGKTDPAGNSGPRIACGVITK